MISNDVDSSKVPFSSSSVKQPELTIENKQDSDEESEEEEENEELPLETVKTTITKSTRKRRKKSNIIYVNLTCMKYDSLFYLSLSSPPLLGCKYAVLRKVIKSFHWVETDDDREWNVFWTDSSVCADRLKRMSSYQV